MFLYVASIIIRNYALLRLHTVLTLLKIFDKFLIMSGGDWATGTIGWGQDKIYRI